MRRPNWKVSKTDGKGKVKDEGKTHAHSKKEDTGACPYGSRRRLDRYLFYLAYVYAGVLGIHNSDIDRRSGA